MGKPQPSLLHLMKPLPSSPQVPLKVGPLNKPETSLPDMLLLEPLSKLLMLPPEMLRHSEVKQLVSSRLKQEAFKLLTWVKLSMLSLPMLEPAMVSFMSLTMSLLEHQRYQLLQPKLLLVTLLLPLEPVPSLLWSNL